MDFVIYRVAYNQTLKVLTVVDPVTNEVLILYPKFNVRGIDVVCFESLCSENRYPKFLQCDNDSDFRSFEVIEVSE